MERTFIDRRVFDGEVYIIENRNGKDGFFHKNTGYFYHIKNLNRNRILFDVYQDEELEQLDHEKEVEMEKVRILPELWVEDLHKHLQKESRSKEN